MIGSVSIRFPFLIKGKTRDFLIFSLVLFIQIGVSNDGLLDLCSFPNQNCLNYNIPFL